LVKVPMVAMMKSPSCFEPAPVAASMAI